MSPRLRTTITVMALALVSTPAVAAEWKHEFAPYVWGSAMEGTVGIGPVSAEAEMSFSDILDDLEFGFMGAYRASRDRYSIAVDAIYMGLGATEKGPGGALKADIDVDQIGLEADFGYAVGERVTLFGGLRYVSLDAELRVTGPLGNELTASEEQDWVDPVVGAIYSWPFADQWTLNLRGDIGGFGVGSDFAWQGMATLRWQFSPRTSLGIAYRYLDMDYEDGKGSDYFKYDMATSGPAMGVIFTF
jgi:opacity protein-like surface antigen